MRGSERSKCNISTTSILKLFQKKKKKKKKKTRPLLIDPQLSWIRERERESKEKTKTNTSSTTNVPSLETLADCCLWLSHSSSPPFLSPLPFGLLLYSLLYSPCQTGTEGNWAK